MIRNLIYAILLGIGMAACLSQQDTNKDLSSDTTNDTTSLESAEKPILPNPSVFVISNKRVGNIVIGMPVKQMREQVPSGFIIADTTLEHEGVQSTAYVLKQKDKDKGILIEQICDKECTVWRINIKNEDFRTSKGIGAGSKYTDVLKHHSISTVTLADAGLVAVAEDGGISFILDQSQLPRKRLSSYTATTLPANTIVKSILIY